MSELITINEQNNAPLPVIDPTTLILCQRTTRHPNSKPGMMLDSLSGALYEYLTIVPMADRSGRVMFPPGAEDLNSEPLCRSFDGVVPASSVVNPPSKQCGNCPMSRWELQATGKKKKPPCSETKTLLALAKPTQDESDPTYNLSGLPLYFNLRGTSLPFYKDFIKQVDRDIEVKRNQGVELSRFDFFAKIKGQQFTSPGGYPYVSYTFSELTRVKTPGQYRSFFDRYVLAAKAAREAAYAEKQLQRIDGAVDNAVGEVLQAEFVEA